MVVQRRLGRLPLALLAGALAMLAWLGTTPPASAPVASAQGGTVQVEWLGWSFFRFTSPNGKVILTNPYITGNADAAVSVDDVTQADLILVADGHGDEVGDALPIAQRTGALVYGPSRVVRWLVGEGLPEAQARGGNQGDRLILDGITVRQVWSVHDNSLQRPTPSLTYGGPASGFYITFENGWTVYFSGSSAATADQGIWGQIYKPDAMIFHMSVTKEPLDAAASIKLTATDNPNLKTVMPHHHRVSPPTGATSVEDVQAGLASMGVNIPITNQARSQVYQFSK